MYKLLYASGYFNIYETLMEKSVLETMRTNRCYHKHWLEIINGAHVIK